MDKNLIYEKLNKIGGKILKNFFIFMGPIYIKLGQLLSYEYPILNELYELQDNCPDLSKKDFLYFKEKYSHLNIFPRKIAAGSISVVYMGEYKDKTIAIKIKRPNIDKHIENNIYYANIIKNILKYIHFLKFLNLDKKIEFIFDMYKKQTDFKQEFINWKIYMENNKNTSNLKIPFFFEELCNEEVIVMEYLLGNNIIHKKIIDENQKLKIGHCIMGQYISGIMKGFIHGDLHCGNLAYLNNNVIIYDFGIMLYLSKEQSNCLIEIINSLFVNDIESAIKIIIDNFVNNSKDENNIFYDITELKKHFENNNLDLLSIILKIKCILESHDLYFNNKMIEIELSLLSLNNTIMNLNISESADYLINDLINQFQNDFLGI